MKQTKLMIPKDSKLPYAAGILFVVCAGIYLWADAQVMQYFVKMPAYLALMIFPLLIAVLFAVICFAYAKRNVKLFIIPIVLTLVLRVADYGLSIYQQYTYQIQMKSMRVTPSAMHWDFFASNNTIFGMLWFVALLLFLLLVMGVRSVKSPFFIVLGLYMISELLALILCIISGSMLTTNSMYSMKLLCGLIFGLAVFIDVLSIKEVNEPENLALEN